MPKRTAPKYTAPASRIEKLDNVPGPEANADVLETHYRRVQDIMATHRYDDVIYMCHWCCDTEAGLAFTKTDQPRGTRVFCTARCANAHTAYMQKVVTKGRVTTPSAPDATEDDSDDAPLDAAQPTPIKQRRVKDVTETVGQEGTGKTDWRPGRKAPADAKKPASKAESAGASGPRKARVTREDGKCSRGLHDMTPENEYRHNGNVWCRACKKLNREKYLAKKNGS